MPRKRLALAACLTALAPAAAAQVTMYGVSADGDLASIDPTTGQATLLFNVAAQGGSLAYDPGSGLIGMLTGGSEPGELILIDPVAQTATAPVPISGLPAGELKTGGMGYSGLTGAYLITFGPTGTFLENRLARIDVGGNVTATSPNLGLGDNDGVVWDDFADRLLVHDYNASDGLPSLAEVTDPFGMPMFSGVANLPSNNNVGDSAVDPASGRLYVSGFDSSGGFLIEIVGNSYVNVGAYNAGVQITGITFVYASPCPGDIADDFGSPSPDGMVSFGDFLALLGLVGPCPGGTPGCTGDIADDFGSLGGDGMVSFGDFLALLGLVGPCP